MVRRWRRLLVLPWNRNIMNDYPVYPEHTGEDDRPCLPYAPV